MLRDALRREHEDTCKMMEVARTKASQPSALPSSLTDAASEAITGKRASCDSARDQLAAFRGYVYTAVNRIATRCARQPLRVARVQDKPTKFRTKSYVPTHLKGVGENLEPLPNHPILELLEDPWALGTAFTLKYFIVSSLELTGRSLLWITTDGKSDKLQIFPIPSHWIDDADRDRASWTIRIPGKASTFDIPGDEVVYSYLPDPSDPWGFKSTVSAIADAVVADQAISEAHWRTFKQGQFPGLAFKIGRIPDPSGGPGTIPIATKKQRKQFTDDIQRYWTGVSQMGTPLLLDGMIEDVKQLSLSPKELAFLESKSLTKEQILYAYSVSEILLGAKDANRASSYEARRIFYDNTVNPVLELVSQALTAFLGPMFAKNGEKLVIYFEEAIPDDEEMTLKKWALCKTDTTRNERRAFLGLPPVKGGDTFSTEKRFKSLGRAIKNG
jgi:phage portal protein BeeE